MAAAPLWLPACSTRWRIFPAARSLDCRPAGRPSKAGQVLVRTDDGDFRARPRPGTGQCRRRDPRSREHGDCPDIGGDHDQVDTTGRVCCRLGIRAWNGCYDWLEPGLMVNPEVAT